METVFSFLDDIIDILIVSYVIYKLLTIVRGTRAMQLLKGIIVIVVAWLVSSFLELKTLQWLMSQAFTYGVLAIIIIFQPELRRALEKLGSGQLFSRFTNVDEHTNNIVIDEITKTANYLAKRKIGLLIVIERNTGLTEYIESGTLLNADISSELIVNIFTPNTPLHDGAVIIHGNKINAAGCYLPLSENAYISKELGTRHRAAIGMTEVSDAVCVIVSEETGQISVTVNGIIIRGLNDERLRNKLKAELSPSIKKNTSSSWRKRWRKNE